MCEADLSSADQVVIFKGDFACLQAINLTNSTTGDLVFMGGTKFLPVGVSSQQNVVRWNSLMEIDISLCPRWSEVRTQLVSWAQRTRDLVDPASSASSTSAKLDPCVSGNNLLRLVQIRVIIQIIHKYDQ